MTIEEITIERILDNFDLDAERRMVCKQASMDLGEEAWSHFSNKFKNGGPSARDLLIFIESSIKQFMEKNDLPSIDDVKVAIDYLTDDYTYEDWSIKLYYSDANFPETDEQVIKRLLKRERTRATRALNKKWSK